MKRALSSRRLLILLVLLLTLALVACERPLNEEDEATATPETPTVPDETVPEGETPAPDAGEGEPAATEQPGTEGGDAAPSEGEPTAPAPEEPATGDGESAPEGGEATSEPAPAEQPTTAPPTAEPSQPAQPGAEQTHVVQSGENLFRIGLRYGCSVLELSTYNGIANPHWINVGQVIRIPPTCGS